jgi:hypothetical protein
MDPECISKYDLSVLDCNIEHWVPLLGDLTYDTLLVPLSLSDATLLLEAYEDTERHPDIVESAAASYLFDPSLDLTPLHAQETVLRVSLGTPIQDAIFPSLHCEDRVFRKNELTKP